MSVTPGIVGCVLAGGRATRMGGRPKAGIPLAGRPLMTRIAARLGPQVETLIVNMDPASTEAALLDAATPIVPDTLPDKPGPLAGILAALAWCRDHPSNDHGRADRPGFVVTVPVDAPFLPTDLVARLRKAAGDAASHRAGRHSIVLAASEGRLHPVFGLWPIDAAEALETWLARGENRSVRAFAESVGFSTAAFASVETAAGTVDPFFNVNTPADLTEAERLFPLLP